MSPYDRIGVGWAEPEAIPTILGCAWPGQVALRRDGFTAIMDPHVEPVRRDCAEAQIMCQVALIKPRRWRLSLRWAILTIAIIACALGAYRHHERHDPKWSVTYPVADLLPARPKGSKSRPTSDFAPLVAAIRSGVVPGSWRGGEDSGSLTEFYLTDSLIVRNHIEAHERLAEFLRELRESRSRASSGVGPGSGR